MKEDLVAITKDLVRFRTTQNRPDQIDVCAEYIARFFDNTGLTVQRHDNNGVRNMVVTKGTKTPKVFLAGHLDVVDGSDEEFKPRVEGNKLYGRGTMDMKSGLAVFMIIMKELAATNTDVGLMITGDEEVGGFDGTGHVMKLGYGAEVVLLPDGGDRIDRIIAKEKGLLQITLSAVGQSAHGSRLWQGENAIKKVMSAFEIIEKLFTPLEAHPEDNWVSTINLGKIEGGNAFNQVPAHAMVSCDIRLVESDNAEVHVKKIQKVLPEGIHMETKFLSNGFFLDMANPYVSRYRDAIRHVGREPSFFDTHGRSDSNFFTPHGIPVLMTQPDGGNLHAEGEWVSIEAIEQYYALVKHFIESVS